MQLASFCWLPWAVAGLLLELTAALSPSTVNVRARRLASLDHPPWLTACWLCSARRRPCQGSGAAFWGTWSGGTNTYGWLQKARRAEM